MWFSKFCTSSKSISITPISVTSNSCYNSFGSNFFNFLMTLICIINIISSINHDVLNISKSCRFALSIFISPISTSNKITNRCSSTRKFNFSDSMIFKDKQITLWIKSKIFCTLKTSLSYLPIIITIISILICKPCNISRRINFWNPITPFFSYVHISGRIKRHPWRTIKLILPVVCSIIICRYSSFRINFSYSSILFICNINISRGIRNHISNIIRKFCIFSITI